MAPELAPGTKCVAEGTTMHRDSPSGSQIRRGRARSNGESAAHRVGALGGAEAAGVGASVEQWRWKESGAAATGARGRAKVAGRLAGFLGVPRVRCDART